jgi:uncharacterized membrane protein YeaQ/YmgE (transglycosylase-associated protein family)
VAPNRATHIQFSQRARISAGFSGGADVSYLIWEIIIGILAGFLAGKIVKGSGMGVLLDLIVGIVGSIIGGWVFTLLGLAAYGLIGQLVMATVGAIILLLIVRAIKKA